MQRIAPAHLLAARPWFAHGRLFRPVTILPGADILIYNHYATRSPYLLPNLNNNAGHSHLDKFLFSTTARTGGKQKNRSKEKCRSSPLEAFFAKYAPKFQYNATASAPKEFCRLCKESGWDKDYRKRWRAKQKFKDALVQQFNEMYGESVDDLASWQNLCHVVRIDPIPDDLHACRKAVYHTFVNLVDLVDRDTTREEVPIFESEKALSEYTLETEKFFPRENVHAGSLLEYLLRHIRRPRNGYNARYPANIQKRKRTQVDCCANSPDKSTADGAHRGAKRGRSKC